MTLNPSNQESEKFLQAILRSDFTSFINKVFNTINPGIKYEPNWHIELISDYLQAMQKGDIKRLIINMPPRGLKSVCVSVAWPAWILGHSPCARIMVASYSHMLSIKHSLDCRLILQSPWYKQLFPHTILSKKHNQKSKFLTSENGFRFATSVGGSATGEGGDFLIVDDPHNPTHINSPKMRNKAIEWFEQTFLTRLNDKNTGCVVLVMQRLHMDDLSGYLLANNGWELLKIPAVAKENFVFNINNHEYYFNEGEVLHKKRDKLEHFTKLEKEIGTNNFAAQYMQDPVDSNCTLLKMEDISFYEKLPTSFDYFIVSWDSAIKTSENSDYSVCSIFGLSDKYYYLVSMVRAKFTYPELKTNAIKIMDKYKPKFVLIEDKASGQQLIQDLRLDGITNITAIKPKLDKITRFASVVSLFQAGLVRLPVQSSFNLQLLKEITNFPNCKNDDIVDSISQFLNFVKESGARPKARIRNL